jgi:hypothetical protein
MALPRNTMLRGKRARRRDYLALAISGTQAHRLPKEITDAVSYPISNLQNYGENHVNGRIAAPSHRVHDQEFDRLQHLPLDGSDHGVAAEPISIHVLARLRGLGRTVNTLREQKSKLRMAATFCSEKTPAKGGGAACLAMQS